MTAIRRYEFDLDFDELDPKHAKHVRAKKEVEKPPEPTFSQAQIDAVRTASLREGHEAGLAEGRAEARNETLASIEARTAATFDSVAACLRSLTDTYSDSFADLERSAIAVAQAIARKALPEVARESATAKTEELVRFCLARIVEEPRVVIRVRDDILDAIQPRIEELGASVGFGGQMIFLSDPELGPGDCRIEWADGGAETGTARVWKEIDGVIEQYFKALDARELPGGGEQTDAAAGNGGAAAGNGGAAAPETNSNVGTGSTSDDITARGEI